MIQVSNKSDRLSNCTGNRQQKERPLKTDFREAMKTKGEHSKNNSVTKEDILKEFPFLSEEDLDNIMKNYDIEHMDSSVLFQLADELMKKNVIPSYSHYEGLDLIAVYPKALYDAVQNGDTSFMCGGIVTTAPDYLYTVNQKNTILTYQGYPEFGLKNIQYGIFLTQNAMKAYYPYYTDKERERALQIEESKKAFYNLADMISAYQKSQSMR